MEQYPMCIAGNLAWLHHMCILHTSAGTTVQAVHWACICDFIFLFHPLLLSTSPPTHTFLSRCFCARACIWHLSGGLRVMPWSCHNLGHCHTYASRYKKLHLSAYHSGWAGTKQQQGFFPLACICPQKPPSCHASPCGLDVSVKTPARSMWNTTQRNSSCFRGLQ